MEKGDNMTLRSMTRPVQVGPLRLGGQDKVLIQTMCNIKTEYVDRVVEQINALADLGADLVRLAIMDATDAAAIPAIKKQVRVPLIADIHFDYKLALAAIEGGIDKIRLNPGNIGSIDRIKAVVEACKAHHIPIRIGVNSGSLDPAILAQGHKVTAQALVASASKHVKILEDLAFRDIVISLKGSDIRETLEAYRLAAATFPYPLHLGITEAGTKEIGIIRSAAGLSPLLLEGIGDTIRISLTGDPREEVIAAKRLLHDLGLYPDYPTLIACPTCGRTQVNVEEVASKVLSYLERIKKPITVAVMGCVVNGPGEARQADIGLAGGRGEWVIFRHGKILKTVAAENAYQALIDAIDGL